jgi:hypothetical protein
MYCPKCSQQQLSDEVRFCSRCGFQLGVVSSLLSADSEFPKSTSHRSRWSLLSSRGTRIGSKLMFVGAFLFVPLFLFGLAINSPGPLIFPLLIFSLGLFVLLYNLIFGHSTPSDLPVQQQSIFNNIKIKLNLPASKSVPITNDLNREPVFEMIRPRSVTDNTTNFLNDDR